MPTIHVISTGQEMPIVGELCRRHYLKAFGGDPCQSVPAFDVVPNPEDTPATLTLQLSLGRYDISREAMLADALRFGFAGRDAAASYLNALLLRIEHVYGQIEGMLGPGLQTLLRKRMRDNIDLLR